MTREELIRNLKYTMKKHEHDRVDTFGTDISLMCKDILDYLEQEPNTVIATGDGAYYKIKALQEPYDFAKWVATEIFDEWEYNKDSFDEIACRKLAKLGIVRAKGDEWELIEQEPCEVEAAKLQQAYNKGFEDCRQAVLDITWEEPSYTDALNVLTEVRDKVKALPSVKPQEPTDTWSIKDVADTLAKHGLIVEQEPCEDAISRQAVKVWLEEMDNKLNPEKYNTIAEYYAVKAQMQKLIYICDIPKEKSCLNCKYNNENLYRGEHCGDCDECMLWEEVNELPSMAIPNKTEIEAILQRFYNEEISCADMVQEMINLGFVIER